MNNVLPFRAPSSASDEPSDSGRVEGEVVYGQWTRVPAAPKKHWMTSHARRLCEKRQTPPSDKAEEIDAHQSDESVGRTLSELIQEIVARPRTPRDVSEVIKALPPVDEVERTISWLVPETCTRKPVDFWISWPRDPHLKKGNPVAKKSPVQEIPAIVPDPSGQHVEDAKRLTPTELRKRYLSTYRSWDGMKTRCKKDGISVHPQFEEFRDFLTYVGPRPEGKTIDCVLPRSEGGRYEPGNVRWLTEKEQAQNRPATIFLSYRGETKPLTDWAREKGQKPDTFRDRYEKGWSHEEVITGHRGERIALDRRPWDCHQDAERREGAERFYQENKRPGETPFAFCVDVASKGLTPWREYLETNFSGDDEDGPFDGVADLCVPELQKGQAMVAKFWPTQRWLERMWEDIKAATALKRPKRSESRKFRPEKSRRWIDTEVAYLNYCESFPELAYRDEDDPL